LIVAIIKYSYWRNNTLATEIKKEIRYLRQLEALGIKTPRRYKKITFIDVSVPDPNAKRHGLIVQKIKGAWDIKYHLQQQAPGDPIHKDWDFLKIFFVNV
jgi:hypothetical protein